MAQNPNDEIQEHSQELPDIITELSAMEKMNSSLLMLSREDASAKHNISSFRLSDLFDELSDELFSILAEAQGKSFSFTATAQDISGSGIGLSLLSLLGNNLGFKIKVSSQYNEFAEFTIIAPVIMK